MLRDQLKSLRAIFLDCSVSLLNFFAISKHIYEISTVTNALYKVRKPTETNYYYYYCYYYYYFCSISE